MSQEAGARLSADAIELQLKDNYGQMVTAISFNSRGREMTISDYGLVQGPPGSQHHIWAIFVDDSAAKIQRDATDRILQPTGDPFYCGPHSATKQPPLWYERCMSRPETR